MKDSERILRLGRTAAVGFVAGAASGVIVGGIGSRLAMRILAVINSEKAGLETENGNIVGKITADGTVSLVVFVGIFAGVLGGLLYVAMRRWVPGSGLWKGLAYGVILFLLFGSIVIDKHNTDFMRLGPRPVSVTFFALLFPLYGTLLSPLVERFDRHVPQSFRRPTVTAIGYFALAGTCAFGLYHTVSSINAIL